MRTVATTLTFQVTVLAQLVMKHDHHLRYYRPGHGFHGAGSTEPLCKAQIGVRFSSGRNGNDEGRGLHVCCRGHLHDGAIVQR